jgi:hypothetical protein
VCATTARGKPDLNTRARLMVQVPTFSFSDVGPVPVSSIVPTQHYSTHSKYGAMLFCEYLAEARQHPTPEELSATCDP